MHRCVDLQQALVTLPTGLPQNGFTPERGVHLPIQELPFSNAYTIPIISTSCIVF